MHQERIADTAVVVSWTLWGISLSQINQLLTTLSLIAATVASVAATIFYLRNRRK